MRTKTNPPTSVSKAEVRRAGDSPGWTLPKITLVSICPKCSRERLQNGYTRRSLFELLKTRRKIDAYCIDCNVGWSISESERRTISPQ